MKRRQVLATLASLSAGGCVAPVADCPAVDFPGEEVCPGHDLDVELAVGRFGVALPAEVTLTVTNRTGREVVLYAEGDPFVYRRVPTGWTGPVGVGRRLIPRENVSITDEHTYTRRLSPYSGEPKSGEHLLVVPGDIETPGGEERRINLVARITFEA